MHVLYSGSVVTAFCDEEDMLKAIYFQTSEMRSTFASYPELLLIDATYKLNDLNMPLYVLMSVDGNGESEIVCLWLTQFEDKETITKLVQEFKKHNSRWSSVECFMSDKDMTERHVLSEQFPQSKLLICLFHTLRSMKREVSTEKLGISQGERSMCLEILLKMVYARNEEYSKLYEELKNTPQRVVEYFDSNWHGIRDEWVDGLKNATCNFMNRTNNRVESINQKLKSVISRYSGITPFFQDLMKCLNTLRVERDHRALEITMKRQVSMYDPSSAFGQYMHLLTPYAFGFIKDQLERASRVQIIQHLDDGKSCLVSSQSRSITSTVESCPCGFISAMQLPCRHILAVRTSYSLPEYDESLCAERWKLQHFLSNHRAYLPSDTSGSDVDGINISTHISEPASAVLSEQQKYRKAFKIAQNLCQKLSTFGMCDFNEGLEVLQSLGRLWDGGKKVSVGEATGTVLLWCMYVPDKVQL